MLEISKTFMHRTMGHIENSKLKLVSIKRDEVFHEIVVL